jgi:glycosyltransferase involved in cell wall biosynthesis
VGRTRITPDLPFKLLRGGYDVYIKCINGRFALPVTYLVARLRRKPFILWTGIWMRVQTVSHRLLFPLTRFLYRHADAILVYGEHVKRYLIQEGVPEQRIFVTAHAVDNDACSRPVSDEEKKNLMRKLNIPHDKKVILYLGRLVESKGLSILLEAFASIKREDAVLLFAGDGEYRAWIERQATERNMLEQIRFAGYVSTDQTALYYALAYVCVLPSITTNTFKEPWGLVVNESFNQGTPVIVTDAVGAASGGLVQDGVNGYIVKERNIDELSLALCRILDNTQSRNAFGKNAQSIIAGWDSEAMVLGFRQAVDYVTRTHVVKNG